MRHLLYTAAGLAALALGPTGAKAQDAEWGCQILLCAASQSPSWQGVPYCVPPMKKLISAMAKPGFDWPVCHQAKAGEPGREEYEECPKGTKVGYSRDRDGFRGEPDQCVKTVDACQERRDQSYRRSGDSSDNRCVSPRARRENPWFFDISNDKGVKERFWFNLNT